MTVALRFRNHFIQLPEPRWTELWSGVACLLWAAYVYRMPETLGERAPYRVLGGIATDDEWAMTAAVVGLLQTGFAVYNWRPARAFANTLGSMLWTCLFTGIVAAHDQAFPGVVLYLNQILMNSFSLVMTISAMLLIHRRAAV